MERDQVLREATGDAVSQIVRKIQGGGPVSPGDRQVLQEALLREPPTSARWKTINAALSLAGQGGTPTPANVGGQPADYGHGISFDPGQVRAGSPASRFGAGGVSGGDVGATPTPGGVEGGGLPAGRPVDLPSWGPGGAATTANSGLLYGLNAANGPWDTGQVPIEPDQVGILRGRNAYGIESMLADPTLATQAFLEESGSPNAYMTASEAPVMEQAMNLARMGVLGTGHGTDLRGNSPGDAEVLRQANEFMEQMYGQDTARFVDTGQMMDEIYQRALNTDWENQTSNGEPLTPDDIINTTNASLMAVSPFMSQGGQAWLDSFLQNASRKYKIDYGKGEVTVSYPEYLRTMGIDKMISGG